MKRKRFYNNKKRNQKWTEEEKGRKIDFADKYISEGTYSDKYDSKRKKSGQNYAKKREKRQSAAKKLLVTFVCIALVCTGYIGMDVYMTRNAAPVKNAKEEQSADIGNMAQASVSFMSHKTESVSLDSSVMLSAVINDAASDGYSSITFDAKRSDGTVGYASALASVDTFGAISSPAAHPEASIKELLANDILPVARVFCYRDSVVPIQAKDAAVLSGKKLYKDSDGNTYLNPDSASAYNYIRDIINELSSYGVSVFVLSACDLPEEISDKYNDGFEALSKKLYSDIDANIKLLEEADVSIKGRDEKTGKVTAAAIKKDISKFKKTDSDVVYYITTKADSKKVLEQLKKSEITCFIIDD